MLDTTYMTKVRISDFAIDFSEYEKKKWIECSEKLPDKDGMYLITALNGGKYEVQYSFYQKNIEQFIDGRKGIAIAWQPIPMPYIPLMEE